MQSSASADRWCHSHILNEGNPLAERNTRWAILLTAVTMVAEIVGGWIYNSMALLADGWHMSSHMLALGLAYMAYRAARHYAQDRRFSFGTWKIEILAGYSSAILLLVVAAFMALHSAERLFNPVEIHYSQAIPIAILGLIVNLICAWLLHDGHHDYHSHHHHHHHYYPHYSGHGWGGGYWGGGHGWYGSSRRNPGIHAGRYTNSYGSSRPSRNNYVNSYDRNSRNSYVGNSRQNVRNSANSYRTATRNGSSSGRVVSGSDGVNSVRPNRSAIRTRTGATLSPSQAAGVRPGNSYSRPTEGRGSSYTRPSSTRRSVGNAAGSAYQRTGAASRGAYRNNSGVSNSRSSSYSRSSSPSRNSSSNSYRSSGTSSSRSSFSSGGGASRSSGGGVSRSSGGGRSRTR